MLRITSFPLNLDRLLKHPTNRERERERSSFSKSQKSIKVERYNYMKLS